jgi:hypothetical protein
LRVKVKAEFLVLIFRLYPRLCRCIMLWLCRASRLCRREKTDLTLQPGRQAVGGVWEVQTGAEHPTGGIDHTVNDRHTRLVHAAYRCLRHNLGPHTHLHVAEYGNRKKDFNTQGVHLRQCQDRVFIRELSRIP